MSSLNPIFIKATTLSDAWFQTIYRCVEQGREFTIDQGSFEGQKRLEFDFVTIQINQPWVTPLLPKVNPLLGYPSSTGSGKRRRIIHIRAAALFGKNIRNQNSKSNGAHD